MFSLTSKTNETAVVTWYYKRLSLDTAEFFSSITESIKRNGLVCSYTTVNCPNRYKSVDTDGRVLYISEKGLCNVSVTVCSLGDYSQIQMIFRPILKGHRFDDAKNSLQYSMMNQYAFVIAECIKESIDSIEGAELIRTAEESVNEA